MEEKIINKDMIELIYQAEENVLNERIRKIDKKVRKGIKDINLEKFLEKQNNEEEIKKLLEKIEDNYSIKISEYTKEFYKQGFKDGVNLILNCLK